MSLEVIGAGWGRTGTDSTRMALEILGYPCHHMKVLGSRPKSEGKFWGRALVSKYGPPARPAREWEKEAAALAWNENMPFKACVDFPFSPFYQELLQANPEAKVGLHLNSQSFLVANMYFALFGILQSVNMVGFSFCLVCGGFAA